MSSPAVKQEKKSWKLRRVFGRGSSRKSSVTSTTSTSSRASKSRSSKAATPETDLMMADEPPLTPLELEGYKSTTHRRLLTTELAEEIRLHIPSILQISHEWDLVYSKEQNGTSLNTLYQNSRNAHDRSNYTKRQGYILCVMDEHHSVFGCYINEYLRPMDRKRYYGNGDCFLWKSEITDIPNMSDSQQLIDLEDNTESEKKETALEKQLRLKVFPYTSLNDFIIYSDHELISIGSGDGKFGLYIDNGLSKGFTDFVETFGNEPLTTTKENKFRIIGLELWKIN